MSKSKRISFENIDKYVEVGFNISFYRKRKGLTQDQLAEKSGISRSHLSAIEAAGIVPVSYTHLGRSPQATR